MKIAINYLVLAGMFGILIVGSHYHQHIASFENDLHPFHGLLARKLGDGFITLTINFLHFFVAKSLQIRLLSIWKLITIPSLLFWVAFTLMILIHWFIGSSRC